MIEKEYRWIRIADSIAALEFQENNIALVETEERSICIGKSGEEIFAFSAYCPHATVPLTNGYIDAVGNVVCPMHHYKFCMRNGKNVSGEGYYLKTWPLEIRTDGIFVGFEKNRFASLLK